MNKLMSRMAGRLANRNRKGFSLVELVVVILIIAILAAAIFLGGATVIKQSRESSVKTDLRNFGSYVQDTMYAMPEIQSRAKYSSAEAFTVNPTNGEITPIGAAANGASQVLTFTGSDKNILKSTGGEGEDVLLTATNYPVLSAINDHLTADFKLNGSVIDPWKNPYVYAYKQVIDTSSNHSASMVIISSFGADGQDNANGAKADAFAGNLLAKFATGTGNCYPTSASEFVEEVIKSTTANYGKTTATVDVKDDYGIVILMRDGAVSTAFFGL